MCHTQLTLSCCHTVLWYRLSPLSSLFQPGAGRDTWTPSVAQNPIPRTDPSELVWHSHSMSQPILGPCPLCVPSVLQYCWRWTGFNFGLDLLVTYTNRYIIFKRNTLNQPCSGSVSLQPRRSIAFRCQPRGPGDALSAASPAGIRCCCHRVSDIKKCYHLLRRNFLCWKNTGDWSDFTVVSPGYAWPRSMAVGRWFAAGQRAIRSWRWRRTRCVCVLLSCWTWMVEFKALKKC